jgi:hypothetical protein
MKTDIIEQARVEGSFSMRVYRKGKLVETYEDHNLIVNGGREQMARLVAGNVANRHITKIAFGTNGDDPLPPDTAITGAFVKPVTGYEYPAFNKVQINWSLAVNENNGMAISEFGLFCADNTLFARKIRATPLNKEDDISIEGQWVIVF